MLLKKQYIGVKILKLMVFVISCHVVASDDEIYGEPIEKIIGGRVATIDDYPYQASVLLNGSHNCGGSIISRDYILTAAHCMRQNLSVLAIRVGSSIRDDGGVIISVKNGSVHPKYTSEGHDYDIAVIELSEQLTYSNGIQPIDLASESDIYAEGSPATITGWGRISPHGKKPDRLRVAVVPYVNPYTCREIYKYGITDNMFCAGVMEGGIDSCQGDSGGPLVIDNKLAGVVSWGIDCAAEDFVGVYSSVPKLRGFIREVTGI